ncbi:MAG TPA: hypothetical protein VIK76_01795 [Pyrinomonadaceae bacterium]
MIAKADDPDAGVSFNSFAAHCLGVPQLAAGKHGTSGRQIRVYDG